MFEYYNNILCVQAGWLYEEAKIITKCNYRHLTQRGWLNVVRRGCKGTPALVEFDSMKTWIKEAIVNKYGDPYKKAKHYQFKDALQPDSKAATFYSTYRLADGRQLKAEVQREYRQNAEILNAIHNIVGSRRAKRKALGGSTAKIWDKINEVVNALDKEVFPHTLPSNTRRLKERYNAYKKEGYTALIHKNFGNNNSRKVTAQMERLILSLYCQPNKPYVFDVHDDYLKFLGRAIDIVDVATGELFNPDDFYNEDGEPITISEATVWNYLRDPKNQIIVDKYRESALAFNNEHRPHHHRSKPQFSLSKISMDDRDLPRKMHDGKRVKAYYSYDVTSGCVIGASYSKSKNTELFINCMREMFRFLNKRGYGIPMEVEVEHHLVNTYKHDLMKAGTVFPFVRWAVPGNAQEKHAEHFNKAKKYGYEKRYQDGIGRFYAKLKANRTHQDKIFDETNNRYKDKTFDFERLIADDMFIIEKYNNDLHPNQKKYKGMTRLEVLEYNINPNLTHYDAPLLARYIGEKIDTSIRRSQYVKALYASYQIPSPQIMSDLMPNNYNVQAYYIPESEVTTVYLYQNETFVCEATKIVDYNTAAAEQNEDDHKAIENQRAYVKEFDTMVKEHKNEVGKVTIIANTNYYEDVQPETVPTTPDEPKQTNDFDELLNTYDEEYQQQNAINSL